MRALSVFVLCSLNEGMSNTILEAMASGLPVIASNVGGNSDLVVDGVSGRLFSPGDVEALTERLLAYLYSPEQRRQHGASGRDIAVNKYGIHSMVTGYEAVWRHLTTEHLYVFPRNKGHA
jgi:glycosyltransferase involved in cell wall biosynthesis